MTSWFCFFPLQQNISLGAPIMSRFDLFFVLVDDCNEVTDYAIARRIVDLHSHKEQAVERVYSMVSHMPVIRPGWEWHAVLACRMMCGGICCLLVCSSPR